MSKYDNPTYWNSIHDSADTSGSLRAVGWPSLSEQFNRIKYRSEADTFRKIINPEFSKNKKCSFMEIGCGIGFFTEIVYGSAKDANVELNMTCLDISETALSQINKKFPNATCIKENLLEMKNLYSNQFDVVTALMVLLHLDDVQKYQEGLINSAKMVKEGGVFILYEPLIKKNYSPFMSINFDRFIGNSYTHSKFYVDNIMSNLGFIQESQFSGASWLLNSPIQSNSRTIFTIKNYLWLSLYFFIYKHEKVTRIFTPILYLIDKFIKNGSGGDSGVFIVYRKVE